VRGSLNWSGYVQKAKANVFTSVVDTWRVPTVSTSSPGEQVSSDWVGVGGFTDRTLVQAGTTANNENGVADYHAWTEILPAAEDPLSMTVNAGDSITTLVRETSPGLWLMQVTDNTTNKTQSRTVAYSSSGNSVEAIHERSTICSGRCTIGTLATTTNVTFDPGSYTDVFQPTNQPLMVPAIKSERHTSHGLVTKPAKVFEILMFGTNNTAIATPSASDTDSDGFTVRDGSTAPPAPGT
jgi:hypothetical protein